jgi:hypothetical protein
MRNLITIIIMLLVLIVPAFAVDGPPIFQGTNAGFVASTPLVGNALAGDTIIVNVPAGQKYVLFRYDFKPQADQTGTTNLQVGVVNAYSIVNALADNVYGENIQSVPVVGADGADLIINTPSEVFYNIAGTIISVGP